jgi:hypothetical protein
MARFGSHCAEAGIADRLRRSAPALIAIFIFWSLLTAAVYRQTASNFLRAESGWFLFLSHSDPGLQHRFEKVLLTKNFWGHYAPIAFVAEFETAKFAGTHGAFWKWRQITILALVATVLYLVARHGGSAFGLTNAPAILSAGALTAVLIFQVQMRDFIGWPFMIMQLGWLLFSLVALLSLLRIVQRPAERRWPWIAAAAAYASLHFLGLGIATVVATIITMIGILVARRPGDGFRGAKVATPLLTFALLATLHAIAMQKFMRVEPIIPSTGWQAGQFLTELLGFIPNLAFASARGLFSIEPFRPESAQISQQWPYGLMILLAISFLVSFTFWRAARDPSGRNQTRFLLHGFASITFLAIITLIAIREWSEPSPNRFADYLSGPRYLIPASLALVAILFELFLLIGSLPARLSVILNSALGLCAVAGHLHFAAHIYPKVAPRAMISHERAWRSIVTMAGECQRAGLAIPNLPLGELTQEFGDWDLKRFEPLLRADLRISPEANLPVAPWSDFANGSPNEYSRKVPALAQVRKWLNLDVPKK